MRTLSLIIIIGVSMGQLAAAAPTVQPSTPCVTPPQIDFVIDVTGREANPPPEREAPSHRAYGFGTLRTVDLDGDGVMDVLVPSPSKTSCPDDVSWRVYLMRGTCGHDVGTVVGSPQRVEQRHEGMHDLVTVRRRSELTDPKRPPGPSNVATQFRVETTYAFADGRYVAGTPETTSGICHHCPISTCRLRPPPPPPRPTACEPLPKPGQACSGSGFCVVDMGQPGGRSTALWCRDGTWQIEEEANLP